MAVHFILLALTGLTIFSYIGSLILARKAEQKFDVLDDENGVLIAIPETTYVTLSQNALTIASKSVFWRKCNNTCFTLFLLLIGLLLLSA